MIMTLKFNIKFNNLRNLLLFTWDSFIYSLTYLFVCFFIGRIFLYSTGCPETHYLDKAGLKFI